MIRRTDNRRRARSLQLLLMGSFCFAINTSIAAPVGGNVINPMNFARMASGAAGGTLTMDVSTGVRTGTGSVIELPGGNPTQMRIDLIADPGVSVTIALPNSIPVIGTNYGSVLTWLPTLNTPAIFNMPPSGTFILNLAGELTIPPGFIADVFAGTVTISIEYSF
jgi:Domain of unknown function (DUF4402)